MWYGKQRSGVVDMVTDCFDSNPSFVCTGGIVGTRYDGRNVQTIFVTSPFVLQRVLWAATLPKHRLESMALLHRIRSGKIFTIQSRLSNVILSKGARGTKQVFFGFRVSFFPLVILFRVGPSLGIG
jgi:hypothetical protein